VKEEEEREKSSNVLKSIEEETFKLNVCFLLFFFQASFPPLLSCFILVENILEYSNLSLDFPS
jgi:hypothetical protein